MIPWHGIGGMGVGTAIVCSAVIALALTGCGGASRPAESTTAVAVPAYGVFPATTVQGTAAKGGDGRACRAVAGTFADDAVDLLAHFGPQAAYPADLNYMIVRDDLASFRAGRCDLRLLGVALERRLTPKERRDLIVDLPRAMGATLRDALARAASS